MKLSTKLSLSFCFVIILFAIFGLLVWNETNKLSQIEKNILTIEDTITQVSSAHSQGLLSVAQSNPELLISVKESLEHSRTNLEKLKNLSSLSNENNINSALTELNSLLPYLMEMNKSFQAMKTTTNNINQLGKEIIAQFDTLISKFESVYSFTNYTTLNTLKTQFLLTRVQLAYFIIDKSPNSAERVKSTLLETQDFINNLEPDHELNKIITNIKKYMNYIEPIIQDVNSLQDNVHSHTLIFDKLMNSLQNISYVIRDNFEHAKNTIIFRIITTTIIVTICGIAFSIFISRNVNKTLGADPTELSNIAKQVTEGTFKYDPHTSHTGVYQNIIEMVVEEKKQLKKIEDSYTKMQKIAQDLEQVTHVASSASQQLSANIRQAEIGADEQAERISSTATAIEQMNSTILEISKSASITSENATSVKTQANMGYESMQECIMAVNDVHTEALKLQNEMTELSDHASAINEVMNVISDIADQTNLLALNAAIEAARAGEAGKGFAVVADEVRNLAEKTMASTTNVGKTISTIQKSTQANSKLVFQTVEKIQEITNIINKTGDALLEIVNLAETNADQVHAIATASEEQSATSEEITRSVEQINNIAKTTTNNMAEAEHAINEVVNQTIIISQLVQQLQDKTN